MSTTQLTQQHFTTHTSCLTTPATNLPFSGIWSDLGGAWECSPLLAQPGHRAARRLNSRATGPVIATPCDLADTKIVPLRECLGSSSQNLRRLQLWRPPGLQLWRPPEPASAGVSVAGL